MAGPFRHLRCSMAGGLLPAPCMAQKCRLRDCGLPGPKTPDHWAQVLRKRRRLHCLTVSWHEVGLHLWSGPDADVPRTRTRGCLRPLLRPACSSLKGRISGRPHRLQPAGLLISGIAHRGSVLMTPACRCRRAVPEHAVLPAGRCRQHPKAPFAPGITSSVQVPDAGFPGYRRPAGNSSVTDPLRRHRAAGMHH